MVDVNMGNIEILGFYVRERDKSEFVLFRENGRMCLTNGVFIWRNFVEKRYLPQLIKTEMIDLDGMLKRLKESNPYSLILNELSGVARGKVRDRL